ncbi:hypothetical protein ACP8HZ_04745 [Francisella noatunensis]
MKEDKKGTYCTSINSDYNAEIAQKLYQSRITSNNHKLSCKLKS